MSYRTLDNNLLDSEQDNIALTIIMNLLIIIMVLFLLFVLSFQLCRVKGSSMLPTLEDKDDLLVTNMVFNYKCDDIVILNMLVDDTLLVKRIVAVGGETIRFDYDSTDSVVYLYKQNKQGNFERVPDSYINEPMTPAIFNSLNEFIIGTSYTLDEGQYLFLGDNRNHSRDSRYYGYATRENLIGKVVLIAKPDTFISKLLNLIFNHSLTENEA